MLLTQLCVTRSRERLLLRNTSKWSVLLTFVVIFNGFWKEKIDWLLDSSLPALNYSLSTDPSQGPLKIRTNTRPNLILWISYLGGTTRTPNYTLGGGFFEPWLFIILKSSQQDLSKEKVKLYFEFARSWSLNCSNMGIFWQIPWNYRFWPLTTTSD